MTTWPQFCPSLTTTYLHVDIFNFEHGQKLAFFGPHMTSFCPRSHWTSPWSEVYLSEMTCYKIHTLISQKSSNRQGKKRQKEKPRHLWENSRQNLKTCHLNHLMIQLLRLSLPNLSARKNLPKIIMLQPSLGKFRNGSI